MPSTHDTVLQIIAQDCSDECAGEPNLQKRVMKAFAYLANGHWLSADEDKRMRGAIVAVLMSQDTTPEEKTRLIESVRALQGVNAMLCGVPIDERAIVAHADKYKPLPLARMWQAAKAGVEWKVE